MSNFKPAHVAALIGATGVAPAVDQIELSPALPRRDTVAYLTERRRVHPGVEARWEAAIQVLGSPAVTTIAQARGVSPAQVVLRWVVQQGIGVIPKFASPRRQLANLALLGSASATPR